MPFLTILLEFNLINMVACGQSLEINDYERQMI